MYLNGSLEAVILMMHVSLREKLEHTGARIFC